MDRLDPIYIRIGELLYTRKQLKNLLKHSSTTSSRDDIAIALVKNRDSLNTAYKQRDSIWTLMETRFED